MDEEVFEDFFKFNLLIGATAKTHGAILITNDSGFNNIVGLQLRNY